MSDCSACRRRYGLEARRMLGCGLELPLVELRGRPFKPVVWQPEHFTEADDAVVTCPGYTTRLPEVIETSRARLWWKEGQLATFVRGEPTEQIALAVEALEIESLRVQEAVMKRQQQQQGGR